MPAPHWRSLLRLFLIGVLAGLPLACTQIVASKSHLAVASAIAECPTGAEGCPCTSGGGCDPGLYCDNGLCVSDSYGGEDEEYMFEADLEPMAAPAPAPPQHRSEAKRGPSRDVAKTSGRERRNRKAGRKLGKGVAESPAAAAPEGAAMPEPVDVAGVTTPPEPSDPADHFEDARQVIYTAGLYLAVYELDAAAELVESLPQRYGGWIESRYDYQITLRIRAERLFEAMDLLMELGVVLDRTLLAEDVTGEYVDLESRILVLEEMVARLEALLALATSVEQALEIRVELDRIRIELEAARVRMRQLAELIDFSTLTVILSPRTDFDQWPSGNDPFPWVDELGVEITAYR